MSYGPQDDHLPPDEVLGALRCAAFVVFAAILTVALLAAWWLA